MRTLEQIKNEYAKSKGYYSWDELICSGHATILDNTINELLILVQKECLKKAQQQLSLENHGVDSVDYGLTNEVNIIK